EHLVDRLVKLRLSRVAGEDEVEYGAQCGVHAAPPIGSGSQGKPRRPRAVVPTPERLGTASAEQSRQHARAELAQLLCARIEHALDLQARLLPGALGRTDLRRCLPAHLAQVHEAVLEVPWHGD